MIWSAPTRCGWRHAPKWRRLPGSGPTNTAPNKQPTWRWRHRCWSASSPMLFSPEPARRGCRRRGTPPMAAGAGRRPFDAEFLRRYPLAGSADPRADRHPAASATWSWASWPARSMSTWASWDEVAAVTKDLQRDRGAGQRASSAACCRCASASCIPDARRHPQRRQQPALFPGWPGTPRRQRWSSSSPPTTSPAASPRPPSSPTCRA